MESIRAKNGAFTNAKGKEIERLGERKELPYLQSMQGEEAGPTS